MFQRVLSSEMVVALRDVIITSASFKFFDKDIALKIFRFVGKPASMSVAALFDMLITQLITLLRIGGSLVDGCELSTILLSMDPTTEFIKSGEKLLYFSNKLYTGIPVSNMKCRTEYLQEIRSLISGGEALYKNLNPLLSRSIEAKKMLYRLKESEFETTSKMNTGTRPFPMGIMLHGGPGIGKSSILLFTCEIWSRCKGRVFDPKQMFHRIATSDYWEGYEPASHPFVHYSELGNSAHSIVQSKGDPLVLELNSVMDTLPFPVDWLSLIKGKPMHNRKWW
jgi:hypothetical protein